MTEGRMVCPSPSIPTPSRERRESGRVLGGTFNTVCGLPLWDRACVAGGRPTLLEMANSGGNQTFPSGKHFKPDVSSSQLLRLGPVSPFSREREGCARSRRPMHTSWVGAI